MALNLSRNTKVFVSSVNGVHASGGSIVSVDGFTAGSGYSVGDIITCTAGGSGSGAKLIVAAVNGSGGVTEVYIPNNYRGTGFADNEALTQASVSPTWPHRRRQCKHSRLCDTIARVG